MSSSQRNSLTPVYSYGECMSEQQATLHRRIDLLTEENDNFRKQIEELTPFRTQFFNLKTSIDHYDTNIADLQHENAKMRSKYDKIVQIESICNEQQRTINDLKTRNEMLQNELSKEQNQNFDGKELRKQIEKLQKENKNLQNDLFREERLHCNKYEKVENILNEYKLQHNVLLQRYSSMESFVEEFCVDANQNDDNEEIITKLVCWTNTLQNKQENINNEISKKVKNGLNKMKNELNANQEIMQKNEEKMHFYQEEMTQNVAKSVLNELICSAVNISNNAMVNDAMHQIVQKETKLTLEQRKFFNVKTQINGQKQMILGLNRTIKDLNGKIEEYEHQNHRLSMQLKQISLINEASQETNIEINLQKIKNLSNELMEKELFCQTMQSKLSSKEAIIEKMENETMRMYEKYDKMSENFNNLKEECKNFDAEYDFVQNENEKMKLQIAEIQKKNEKFEENYAILSKECEELKTKCAILKQNEYNFKLNEQALIEKYNQNYREFNVEYESLQNKVQIMEKSNECLNEKIEKFEQIIHQQKEESNTVNIKYNTLKFEYEKLTNKYTKNQKKFKKLQQNLDKSAVESDKILELKREIETMQQQLFEGSNIRRELREFVTKYQRDGQEKLNKNYEKLMKMKQCVIATINVMNDEWQYIEKNDILCQHFDFLMQRLHQNKENHSSQNNKHNKHNNKLV